MRRIRGKVIAVCTVIAVILAAKAALTAQIPVVYAVEENDDDLAETESENQETEEEEIEEEETEEEETEEEPEEQAAGNQGPEDQKPGDAERQAVTENNESGSSNTDRNDQDGEDADIEDPAEEDDDDAGIDGDAEQIGLEMARFDLRARTMEPGISLLAETNPEPCSSYSALEAYFAGNYDSGVVITLADGFGTNDTEESIFLTVSSGKTITLNMNRQTLKATIKVNDGGELTIDGGGTINAVDGAAIQVEKGGKLTIKSGTFDGGEGPGLHITTPSAGNINLSGGTYNNGIQIEIGVLDSKDQIGAYAEAFCNMIGKPKLSENTFYVSDGVVSIESPVTVSSGTWDGTYKETRTMTNGQEYSFKDDGCKVVGGTSNVYSSGIFYVVKAGTYTFTNE